MTAGRMQKATRKIHAEHHDSTLDAGQASFSLPIPSGATPDFSTSGGELRCARGLPHLLTADIVLTRIPDHSDHQSNFTGLYGCPS